MRNSFLVLLISFCAFATVSAQVKIGDNPQNIDPSSVLELESTDKVLVITRVTTAQMNAIVPSEGALCFNTDLQSVHYYNGTQWVNIGGASGTGGPLTADPIVNTQPTIVITPTATGDNLEVAPNSIRSDQIVDGGINGVDLQDGSIGPGKLQDFSITQEKLSENSVGAFALDNDSFGVSAFNNDAGYITAGDINIVSGDAGNVLETRADGVFYNDQPLITAINQNTDAIMLDTDQSPTNEIQSLSFSAGELTISGANSVTIPTGGTPADGSETIVTAGTNITVTGDGTTGTPYIINSTGGTGSTEVVDGSTLIGAGTTASPFEIAPSGTNGWFLQTDTAGDVVWAELPPATSGGVETDGLTIIGTGADVANQLRVNTNGISTTEIANATILGEDIAQMAATDGQVLAWDDTAGTWGPSNAGGTGGNQNLEQVLTQGNDGGAALIKNISDPVDNQDVATKAYVDAAVTAGGGLTDGTILIGGTGDVAQQLAMSGDATLANDGALTIADAAITENKLAPMGATADGDIIKWNTDINGDGSGGGWEVGVNAGHTGTAKSIFLADASGNPTQAFHPTNSSPSLVWDYDARVVFGTAYGALGVGLDGATFNNEVKMQVVDNVFGGLSYPLQVQNNTNGSSSTGIVFSTGGGLAHGKGVLAFQNTGSQGIGDFHFLIDANADTSNAELNDKAFTVKNNKDIVLYGGIEIDGTGPGTGLGGAGQVLSSTGTGVQWIDAAVAINDIDTNDGLAYGATVGYNINTDEVTIERVSDALQIKDDGVTSAKIADANVTPVKLEPSLTDGQVLTTTGGIAVWAAPTAGAVSTDATIDGDGDTTPLGIANDAITTARILDGEVQTADIADSNVTPVKLEPSLTDGQVLTTTGGVAVWAAPTAGAVSTDATIDGDGDTTPLSIADDAITTARILDGEVQTADIANGAIVGGSGGVIADNSITASDIQNDAVDSGEIRMDAVGESEIRADAVRTGEILNLTILNEDISATAAIDGTKVNPDFGAQNIITTGDIDGANFTATGNLVVGGTVTVQGTPVHPDYVFQSYFLGNSELKSEYDFPTLEEIEKFIKKNHHLPGIKSAEQVKKDGFWNLSDSNIQNLEKIEELFLHTIEQEKKIKTLKSENNTLKTQVGKMKKDLEEIKKLLKDK